MITPERKKIEEILKATGIRYSVPSYQRHFNWGEDELQELIDDLKNIQGTDKELFLGNFIFDVSERNNYKIVDGQQRLTTISLILIALREQAKKINEFELAKDIQSLIDLSTKWSKERGNRISVSINIRDAFDYISNMDWDGKFPEKIGTNKIKKQVNKIKPIFDALSLELSAYNSEELISFISALLNSYVIVINVENTEDVFAIFERTNARGLDLNTGDLLKNHIFSHGIEDFEERWSEIIENAEGGLQRMLKYFWISRKEHALQSQLYKGFREYGKELGIGKFVEELYEFSRYYKTINSADPEEVSNWLDEIGLEKMAKNEDSYRRISRVFQALKLFRVTQAYPVIFSIFKFYKKTNSNEQNILFEVLETMERYHFTNNVIAGKIGNEVEKFYAKKAREFFDAKENFEDNLKSFVKDLSAKRTNKETFIATFVDTVTYEQRNLVKYVFDRINNFETKGAQRISLYYPEKDIKVGNYNIEHFLPQNKKKDFEKSEDLEIFDKIGNLLVIPSHSNSSFKDKNPIEKIEIMKSDLKYNGNLRYIDDFLKKYDEHFDSWGLEEIKKRSEEIATIGYEKIWKF